MYLTANGRAMLQRHIADVVVQRCLLAQLPDLQESTKHKGAKREGERERGRGRERRHEVHEQRGAASCLCSTAVAPRVMNLSRCELACTDGHPQLLHHIWPLMELRHEGAHQLLIRVGQSIRMCCRGICRL